MFDEEVGISIPGQPGVGAPIDDLSVDDLEERMEILAGEIERCKAAIQSRHASRAAADAVFGAPKA